MLEKKKRIICPNKTVNYQKIKKKKPTGGLKVTSFEYSSVMLL